MKIYIILLLLIIILSTIIKPNKNNTAKKIYLFFVFAMLTIVAAIRTYNVGIDTKQFYTAFMTIANMNISELGTLRYEFGFSLFCKIISIISKNPQIIIASSSLVIFPIIGRFIYKNSKDVTFSTIIFILLNYYFLCMNVMRQAIAIAILLIAYEFLKNNKKVQYILLVCIASFFHSGAIGAIILLLFVNKEYNIKHYFITMLIAALVFLFSDNVFNILTTIISKYAGYIDSQFYESNYFAAVLQAMVSLIILTFGSIIKNINKTKEDGKTINLLAYFIALTFIFNVLSIKITISGRISAYFSIYTIIWIPEFISRIQKLKEKLLYRYVIIISMLAYWLIIAIYRPEWYGAIPYTWILGG